jgi:hypothetical protein
MEIFLFGDNGGSNFVQTGLQRGGAAVMDCSFLYGP